MASDEGRAHGTLYQGDLRDTSEQLLRNLYALKRYLGENGFRAWIKGAVVFTNPDSRLVLKSWPYVGAVRLDNLASLTTNIDEFTEDQQVRAEELILGLPDTGEAMDGPREIDTREPVLKGTAGNTS